MTSTDAYAGTGTGAETCVLRDAYPAAVALPRTADASGVAKTMCFSKKTPAAAADTPDETGALTAFIAEVNTKITGIATANFGGATEAKEWKKMADDALAATSVPVGATALQKRNYNEEFISIWEALVEAAFDQTEIAALTAALTGVDSSDTNGSSNQFGSEFGKIYKDLTGADKTKADGEIAKIFYFIHKKMHTKIYETIQK